MAAWYVWSGATGTAAGTSWANAKTTMAAAITAAAAGDTYYVAHDHAETQAAALTLTFKGASTGPDNIFCVNRAGSVPPVAADLRTTATISQTAAAAITINGDFYMYGVTFIAGSAALAANLYLGAANNNYMTFDSCGFTLNTTATTSRLHLNQTGSTGNRISLLNCTLTFGSVSQTINTSSSTPTDIYIRGGTLAGTIFPTTLFGGITSNVYISGFDFSALGSGKTIIGLITGASYVEMVNCKLGASVTVSSLQNGNGGCALDVIGCHSSGNVERNERYRGPTTLTTETTIIRTAGASDGTTPFSWKIVCNSNNYMSRTIHFECFEGAIWNATTGSAKTLTAHCLTDSVTLQDADLWLEVEYLGASGSPVTTLVSSAPAMITAGTNLTSDSGEAWTTTGLTTPVKQKFSVTFTPQMAGLVRWKIVAGKPSIGTVYVCPKADLA